MAPNNEVSTCAHQSTFNFFEELQKSIETLHKEFQDNAKMVKYPAEDNIEETDDKVTVTLSLGDFKPEQIEVRIDSDTNLVIEGHYNDDKEQGHRFIRSLQLPFPCIENEIKTQFDNDKFTIVAIKDHERAAQLEKEMKDKEQKIMEAIEKFNAMKAMEPIVLENVEEDDKYYNLMINLGDYAKDELSIQFYGPHNMTIEAAKDGEIPRRFVRQIYFELPCKVDQDILVLEENDNMVIVKIAKDLKVIKEIEEFNKQMKPIHDFFDGQDIEIEDNENEIQMKLSLKDFSNDEVKVTIDDVLIIEANHEDAEQGTKLSFYRSFPIPDGIDKDAIKHSIDQDGQLVIRIPKVLRQQG